MALYVLSVLFCGAGLGAALALARRDAGRGPAGARIELAFVVYWYHAVFVVASVLLERFGG